MAMIRNTKVATAVEESGRPQMLELLLDQNAQLVEAIELVGRKPIDPRRVDMQLVKSSAVHRLILAYRTEMESPGEAAARGVQLWLKQHGFTASPNFELVFEKVGNNASLDLRMRVEVQPKAIRSEPIQVAPSTRRLEPVSSGPEKLVNTDETRLLYIEVINGGDFPRVTWASIRLDATFIGRVLQLQDLCSKNDLASIRVNDGPSSWHGEKHWRPSLPAMNVSKDDFWFSALPRTGRAQVKTRPVPIDTMTRLLRDPRSGSRDERDFSVIEEALYYDGSDAESLAKRVSETLASIEA